MTLPAHRGLQALHCLVLASLLVAGLAHAGLTGLVHDADSDAARIALIDSSDGSVSLGAATIPDCCYLAAGLTAVDLDQDRVFAYGQLSSGAQAGSTVLMTFSLDGATALSSEPAQVPQAILAWDGQSGRLISAIMSTDPDTIQWVSINPQNGDIDPIGDASTECCELITGMADVGEVPGGGRGLYTIGRPFDSSDWHLLAVNLADGAIAELATLPPGRPGFLVFDDASGQADVLMQTSPQDPSVLYRIDPADGSIVEQAVNSADNCCLVSPGDTASQSMGVTGATWWVAGNGASSSPGAGFFAMSANDSNALTKQETLEGNLYLHALIVSGTVVDPGLLFQDRFEPQATREQ